MTSREIEAIAPFTETTTARVEAKVYEHLAISFVSTFVSIRINLGSLLNRLLKIMFLIHRLNASPY